MSEAAVSLWTHASRKMLERIDDTARRVSEGFPNFADPHTGSGRRLRRVIGREATGSGNSGSRGG
jgi:hypothetical protein